MVAQQAASVFHNAEVFERAHEASLTDPLTGLANRRALQASLGRELSRAERQRSSFALIMLDLDGLKYLNDTFGHHVGDRAIVTVAHVLRSMLRPYDLCARYAGDEFVAVLWDCDLEQAEFRRRELQEAIATAEIEVAPARTLHLAMSAGAALYPDDGEDEAALVSVADQRMYRDKAFRKRRGLGPDRATPAEPQAARLM